MKFATAFALLAAAAATTVGAARDTNAHRLARGLPLLPPVRRATPVAAARRNSPSGTPDDPRGPTGPTTGQCNTGPIQCCNSVTKGSDPIASTVAGLLGIVLDPTASVGMTCSPLAGLGLGGNSCKSAPVCCENNHFQGLLVVGCSPVSL